MTDQPSSQESPGEQGGESAVPASPGVLPPDVPAPLSPPPVTPPPVAPPSVTAPSSVTPSPVTAPAPTPVAPPPVPPSDPFAAPRSRPELCVAGAFAGGLVLALIFKRLAR